MSERITELESQLQAWERWNRRRTLLLVLVPVLIAAALAYAGQARLARIERALGEGLAGLSAEPSPSATLEQDLARLPGLVAELKSLRPLPAQLMAERGARSRAEADLARLGEETSNLIGERDRLATALETTKAELARAQAERAESEQRLHELERTRQTGQVALSEADSPAPAPCAMDDLDCRAFTGTLDWQPNETQPLLSGKTLRRLTLLRHLPGGQRERALRCLAFIAWAEARSDGIEGMRAVIIAVLNRARDPAFLDHPCATVGQPGAFEPMTKHEHMHTVEALRQGRLAPFPRPASVVDLDALETARLLAFRMAHSAAFKDPTNGATHFLAPRVLAQRGQAIPAWTRELEPTARIGSHHFYRRPIQVIQEP